MSSFTLLGIFLAALSSVSAVPNVLIDGYGYSLQARLASAGTFPAGGNVTGWTVEDEALYSPEIPSKSFFFQSFRV